MEISNKLFPYPVLASFNDDYIDSIFDVNIRIKSSTRKYVTFEIQVTLENDHLLSLIENDFIDFAIHIECSNTSYRSLVRFDDLNYELVIPSGMINKKVTLCPYILARKTITEYFNPRFSKYYNGLNFFIDRHSILAISLPSDIFIEKDYDEVKKVSSIFSIVKDLNEESKDIIVEKDDLIRIKVPQKQYDDFKFLTIGPSHIDVMNSIVIVPVLVGIFEECMRNGLLFVEENQEYKWYRAIKKALSRKNIDFESETFKDNDSLSLAQSLLENPITKAIEKYTKIQNRDLYED